MIIFLSEKWMYLVIKAAEVENNHTSGSTSSEERHP